MFTLPPATFSTEVPLAVEPVPLVSTVKEFKPVRPPPVRVAVPSVRLFAFTTPPVIVAPNPSETVPPVIEAIPSVRVPPFIVPLAVMSVAFTIFPLPISIVPPIILILPLPMLMLLPFISNLLSSEASVSFSVRVVEVVPPESVVLVGPMVKPCPG